jgi:hypothetical protein
MPRSVENVIAELENLHATFCIRHFMFVDDNFMGPGEGGRQRAHQFAEEYRLSGLPMTFEMDCRAADIERDTIEDLQAAGLESVFIGIESVSEADLQLYRKGLTPSVNRHAIETVEEMGLNYTLSMIMFNAQTTRQAILDNVDFLKQIEFYPRNPMAILNLYEGTGLMESLKPYIFGPFWDYRFDFAHKEVKSIFECGAEFFKATIPLERELTRRVDQGTVERGLLYQMRLSYLEDVANASTQAQVSGIKRRWRQRLDRFRRFLDNNGFTDNRP